MSTATAMTVIVPSCAECASDMHHKCFGKTWVDDLYRLMPCPCAKAGHQRQLSAPQEPN